MPKNREDSMNFEGGRNDENESSPLSPYVYNWQKKALEKQQKIGFT